MAPKTARTELLQQTRAIANAGGALTKAEGDRLDRLSQALAAPIETPEARPPRSPDKAEAPGRTPDRKPCRTDAGAGTA